MSKCAAHECQGWGLTFLLTCFRACKCCAGTYKIPTANDIPLDLRVTLLRDAPCRRTPQVHSSKAVGEPPLFLGASVFFALKARSPFLQSLLGKGSFLTEQRSPLQAPEYGQSPVMSRVAERYLFCTWQGNRGFRGIELKPVFA